MGTAMQWHAQMATLLELMFPGEIHKMFCVIPANSLAAGAVIVFAFSVSVVHKFRGKKTPLLE